MRAGNSLAFHKLLLENPTCVARVIHGWAQTGALARGKQLHAQLISTGYPVSTFLANHLLILYSKIGQLDYALKLFDRMSQRNLVSWTSMISGFSQNSEFLEGIRFFCRMRNSGKQPNQFAFSSVIRACLSLELIDLGRQVHCLAAKLGFDDDVFVGSNLLDLYSRSGVMVDACKVFEEIQWKDEVLWTALIDGYAKNCNFEDALLAFKRLLLDGVDIDLHILCSSLSACGSLRTSDFGKCLHSLIVKIGFELQTSVVNALTDMYSKMGDMMSASNLWSSELDRRNVVSYTSLIDGYVEKDQTDKALDLFLELMRNGILPNQYTLSSLIKACANEVALEQGIQFHSQVIKFNLDKDPFISSTLVDMYGKCGLVDDSIKVFDNSKSQNEILWNTMLNVFAQHGLGNNVIEIFEGMINEGVKPNSATFVSLLIGCSHAGLVEEGLRCFYSMEKTHGVVPKEEHYSCVIDMLARAGKLKETENFIRNMPFKPSAFGWCSFLAACKIHGDKGRAKIAAENLMQIEPENSGAHVLLSNIYAKEQQWENVRTLRKMLRDGNVKKLPGYSWVEFGHKTHYFGVEDWSHPQKAEIYEKLDTLFNQIKKAGYIPQTDIIPYDMDNSVKEKMLQHHSERIAVAFALISMPVGRPIIVKKNLRICTDCHSAIKYISKVVGRKIIVRDSSRFHHFADGLCSCGDFW